MLSGSPLTRRSYISREVNSSLLMHLAILKSEELVQYLQEQSSSLFVELGSITENDLAGIRSLLKSLPINQERVSSYFTTQ
jgi:hypothetical protein